MIQSGFDRYTRKQYSPTRDHTILTMMTRVVLFTAIAAAVIAEVVGSGKVIFDVIVINVIKSITFLLQVTSIYAALS